MATEIRIIFIDSGVLLTTWGEGNGSRDQNHWHFVVKDVVENRIFLRHVDADDDLVLRYFRSINPIDLVDLGLGSK